MAVNKRLIPKPKKSDRRYVPKFNKYDVEQVWADHRMIVQNANDLAFSNKCPFGKKCRALQNTKVAKRKQELEGEVDKKFGGRRRTRKTISEIRKFIKAKTNSTMDCSFNGRRIEICLGSGSYHSHHLKKSPKNYCDSHPGQNDDCSIRNRSATPAYCLKNFDNWKASAACKRFKSSLASTVLICRYCHSSIHSKLRWDPVPWAVKIKSKSKIGNLEFWVHEDAKNFVKDRVKGFEVKQVEAKKPGRKKGEAVKKKLVKGDQVRVRVMKLRSGKMLDKNKMTPTL